MIDVTLENYKKVQEAFKNEPRKVNLIISRAVNRATTTAKAAISKKVRETYVIKASDIKNTISVKKATVNSPCATVKSSGRKINLEKFRISPSAPRPQKPPKSGYKVQVRKKEGLKAAPQGFLAYGKGDLGFFQRTTSKRMPVKRLMGPSVPEMIGRKSVIEWVESEAQKTLDARVEHELQRELEAKKK